jgi:hypothetical protein
MPNQTIDLWNGLEAWYDLDPRYYDNQRGVLADKSGHGRVADVRGSVSIGVEGPDSFKASEFSGNGSGDFLVHEDEVDGLSDFSSSFTAFTLVNPTSGTIGREDALAVGNNSQFGWIITYDKKDEKFVVSLEIKDGSGGFSSIGMTVPNGSMPPNRWYVVTLKYDISDHTFTLTVGGETVIKSFDYGLFKQNNDDPLILVGKSQGSSGREISGSIASSAIWSRTLSDAEIEYLNNLTAPPRSL